MELQLAAMKLAAMAVMELAAMELAITLHGAPTGHEHEAEWRTAPAGESDEKL